jgi:hypothetical protein
MDKAVQDEGYGAYRRMEDMELAAQVVLFDHLVGRHLDPL